MSVTGDWHRAWRALPEGSLDDIIGSGTCLVLAPHPDDETLGCGGLIARCIQAGRSPLIAVLTDGAGSHPNSLAFPPDRLRAVRAQEVQEAVLRLGSQSGQVTLLNLPDGAAPSHGPGFDAAVANLSAMIRASGRCTSILAPWLFDPHCDHEAAAILAAAVAKTTSVRHVSYPVWGWTLPEDMPIPHAPGGGFRLDIAQVMPLKQAAIEAHCSQYGDLITDDPHGFRLPANLLAVFKAPFETFLVP